MKEQEFEVWKPVVGYEGLYEVSSFGRVKSLDNTILHKDGITTFRKGRILKSKTERNGYMRVVLSKESKHIHYSIHRLVAYAFIPNPYEFPCVNHKDENKQNNHVDNLEWCTHKYNNNYGNFSEKLSSSLRKNGNKNIRRVLQVSLDGTILKEYECMNDVKIYGFCPAKVGRCCRNKNHNFVHLNYIWVFKEDEDTIERKVDLYKTVRNHTIRRVIVMKYPQMEFIGIYDSLAHVSKVFNIPKSCICLCCNNKQIQSKGYTFKYAEQ